MNITDLEEYFKTATLPKELQINRSTRITNVRRMVDNHLEVLKQNGDKPTFSTFYDRLLQVKEIIEKGL